MLVHVLDAVLGTTTMVRILRTLFPLGSAATGNEARGLARVRSVRATYAAPDELTSLGILLREETRGPHLYRVNRDHHLAEPLAALFAAESRRVGEIRTALQFALETSGHLASVVSMVLYGSNARGEARPASDLDVLVVTRDPTAVRPVQDALLDASEQLGRRFGIELSAYVLAEARVRDRYRDGDPLMLTLETEGRELHGTPFPDLVRG